LVVEPAFHIGQTSGIKVRKANNGANKQEKHDGLGVHFSASPNLNFTGTNTTPKRPNAPEPQHLRKQRVTFWVDQEPRGEGI
jgi:hypothetical protein